MVTTRPAPLLQVLDPAARREPYGLYRRILQEAPVSEGPPGLLTFARYADCASLLRDSRLSSDDRNAAAYQALLAAGQISRVVEERLAAQPFLLRDPPDHTRLRRLVAKAFTPRVVEQLRPRIHDLVDGVLDRAAARGRLEVVGDLAYPVPVAVICELLGIPSADQHRFPAWSRALARSIDPPFTLTPEEFERQEIAYEELSAYMSDLVERRRRDPHDDLLSALVAAEEQGEHLTRDEVVSTAMLLLIAGHETTVNLIANGILALLRHPGSWRRLAEDPTLSGPVVEEVLRFDPPVHFRTRVALEDVAISGVTIPKGSHAVLLLGAANRDPERFADPDRFVIDRADTRHLAFGAGIHFCLGAPLARLEGRIALEQVTRRVREPRLLSEDLDYHESAALRGLVTLPIGFPAVAGAT